MATTTADAIRQSITTRMAAIAPTSLVTELLRDAEPHIRGELPLDAYARQGPSHCFRLFEVAIGDIAEPPIVSNGDAERWRQFFEITITYPTNHYKTLTDRHAINRVMDEDRKKVHVVLRDEMADDDAAWVVDGAEYVREVDRERGVSMWRIRALYEFWQLVGDLPPPPVPVPEDNNWQVPITNGQVAAMLAAGAGVGSYALLHSYDFQDAASPPPTAISATEGTDLTPIGDIDYEQDAPDFDESVVLFTEALGVRAEHDSAIAPDPSTDPFTVLAYYDYLSAPAAARTIELISDGAPGAAVLMTSTPRLRAACAGVNVDGTVDPVTGGRQVLAIAWDPGAADRFDVATLDEIITGNRSNVANGNKGIGQQGSTTQPMTARWRIVLDGAMSRAELHAVIAELTGEVPGWTP